MPRTKTPTVKTGYNPFIDAPPAEVPLKDPPLVAVVAQIRFPRRLSITNPSSSFVSEFQELIRGTYRQVEEVKIMNIKVSGAGVDPELKPESLWRFFDKENKWRVSLSPEFISLDTTSYSSRTDFVERLMVLVDALEQALKPDQALRIGIRYLNRLSEDKNQNLKKIIKPEALGTTQLNAFESSKIYLMNDAAFKTKEGEGKMRWGYLPADATHEPELMSPVNYAAWVCDIDSTNEEILDFNSKKLRPVVSDLAGRAYAMFRSLVTDDFLTIHGGKV